MPRRRAPFLLLTTALLVASVCPGSSLVARAQPRDPDEPQQYRTMIARAVSEYEAGRWNEARANFRRAHQVFPNARTLRGIGMTSFELAEYVEAIRNLTASLAETRRALTPEQRAEVEELLDRARTYVGRYRLEIDPAAPASTITVDRQQVEPQGDVLLLDLGRHEIVVRAEGYEPATRTLQVRGGEDESLRVTLGRTRAPTPPTTPEPPPSMQPDAPEQLPDRPDTLPEPRRPSARRRRPRAPSTSSGGPPGSAFVLLGIGGALGVGAVASTLYLVNRGAAASECDGTSPEGPCTNGDTIDGQHDLALGLTLGLGAAALGAAAAGVVMIVTGGDRDEPARGARAELACAPAGAGLVCRGAF